jgi:ribosomal protein S18 acetylase RimI-like enzyme
MVPCANNGLEGSDILQPSSDIAPSMILPAKPEDEAAIVQTLVLAFSADPAVRWTWPDPVEFLKHFPQFIKAFGGNAFSHKSAYRAEGHAGAALWLPPGVGSDDEGIDRVLSSSLSGQRLRQVVSLMDKMGRYHPSEPHWYLPLMGVDPYHQGRGHGSALLKEALKPCDQAGQLAYLESTNPKSVGLYERHGFELLGSIQEGDSPTIFPMLRRPRHDFSGRHARAMTDA